MSNLAHIAEQLDGMSADLQALEKTLAQSERERWLYERSVDRIPELVREGELLADEYRMDYAVVRELDGRFVLVAAAGANKAGFISHIRYELPL